MEKIITIGSATQDIFLKSSAMSQLSFSKDVHNSRFVLLPEGAKLEVEALHYALGGGALNSAVSFQRQGFAVEACFKIGNDTTGEAIINSLQQQTIGTRYHAVSKTEHTGRSFIIPTSSNNKTVLVYHGANSTLAEAELPIQALQAYKYVYITSLHDNAAQLFPLLVEQASRNCSLIAANPGKGQMKTDIKALIHGLPYVHVFILNASEARFLFEHLLQDPLHRKSSTSRQTTRQRTTEPLLCTNFLTTQERTYTIFDYFAVLHTLGPSIVIVTNGAEGVYVSSTEKQYFHPSIKLTVTSTVGAGDAFGSTFVGTYIHTQSIEQAIASGIINSASVISGNDAQEGLLSQKELTQALHTFDNNKLIKI